jgi:hypothetical protein
MVNDDFLGDIFKIIQIYYYSWTVGNIPSSINASFSSDLKSDKMIFVIGQGPTISEIYNMDIKKEHDAKVVVCH